MSPAWRAKLRADVLPVLEAIRPGAGQKATAFADHLRDVHRVLDDAIEEALKEVDRSGEQKRIDRETARCLNPAVLSSCPTANALVLGVGARVQIFSLENSTELKGLCTYDSSRVTRLVVLPKDDGCDYACMWRRGIITTSGVERTDRRRPRRLPGAIRECGHRR